MRRAKPQPQPLGGLMRLIRAALAGARRRMRPLRHRLLHHIMRQPGHLVRVLARLKTRAKTRRQDNTETELP